jgi:hypothetical protein
MNYLGGLDEAGVAEVVEAALREDLGVSLEPGHVVGGLERLGDDSAKGAEHGPASELSCGFYTFLGVLGRIPG